MPLEMARNSLIASTKAPTGPVDKKLSDETDVYKSVVLAYYLYMNTPQVDILSSGNDKIYRFLSDLGLSKDQSDLYVYLQVLGPSSVLALSKAMATGRTRLYPILESLQDINLVKIDEKHYGTTYEALAPSALEYLVTERVAKTAELKENLLEAQSLISQLSGSVTKGSKVIEYKGVEGLKQINFNLTKAHKQVCVFELAHLDEHSVLPKAFVDRLRYNFVQKQIVNRDITNNPDFKFVNNLHDPKHLLQRACYIDKALFPINVETYIYNDCIAYLQYDQDEIFGVEIHNQALADQQKALFELVWSQGTQITD